MSSLKEINLKINSLKNTKKITEAMRLIAITKLSRAEQNVKKAINYHHYLKKILSTVGSGDDFKENRFIEERNKVRKIKVILFTSDKGLCGPFNSNVLKKANSFIRENSSLEIVTEHFGKKGYDFFNKQNLVEEWHKDVFKEDFDFAKSNSLIKKNQELFFSEKIDGLYLIYNEFVSVLKQVPVVKRILPFALPEKENNDKNKMEIPHFIYEPDKTKVTDSIIKKIIYFEFYFAYLNSVAGENSARMTAMDNATNNCNDMIGKFTLERNQLRQANITKELIEIISGAESV